MDNIRIEPKGTLPLMGEDDMALNVACDALRDGLKMSPDMLRLHARVALENIERVTKIWNAREVSSKGPTPRIRFDLTVLDFSEIYEALKEQREEYQRLKRNNDLTPEGLAIHDRLEHLMTEFQKVMDTLKVSA